METHSPDTRIKHIALALFATCAAVAACSPKGAGDIPVVDVTKTYPHKDVTLQDIADVEYVPLETREGFLIGDIIKLSHMDDDILLTHNDSGDIMTFDRRTGKGITSFNRRGRGPGEYSGVGSMAVDARRGEIFVVTNEYTMQGDRKILVYDTRGKLLRKFDLAGVWDLEFLSDYDAESLFFHNSDISRPEPFGLIAKADGAVSYLPLKYTGRDNMDVEIKMGEFFGHINMNDNDGMTKSRDGFVSSEPGIDTIYDWHRATGRLVPIVARRPSFHSMETPVALFFLAENRDCMFFQTVERKFDWDTKKGFDAVNLIYDKKSGEFFEGYLANADYADERMFPLWNSLMEGTFVQALQPFELVDLHKEGKLRGRLAEIAPTLREDDNPVMMTVKFK